MMQAARHDVAALEFLHQYPETKSVRMEGVRQAHFSADDVHRFIKTEFGPFQ